MKGKGRIWGEDANHPKNRKDLITGLGVKVIQISHTKSWIKYSLGMKTLIYIYNFDIAHYCILKYVRTRTVRFKDLVLSFGCWLDGGRSECELVKHVSPERSLLFSMKDSDMILQKRHHKKRKRKKICSQYNQKHAVRKYISISWCL